MLLECCLIAACLTVDPFENFDDDAREAVGVEVGFLVVWYLADVAVEVGRQYVLESRRDAI
jgi:hypothetical protein